MYGECSTLESLGLTYTYQGKYSEAINLYQQCLSIASETKNRYWEAIALTDLSSVYRGLGNYVQADIYNQENLAIVCETGDRRGEAWGVCNSARTVIELD